MVWNNKREALEVCHSRSALIIFLFRLCGVYWRLEIEGAVVKRGNAIPSLLKENRT